MSVTEKLMFDRYISMQSLSVKGEAVHRIQPNYPQLYITGQNENDKNNTTNCMNYMCVSSTKDKLIVGRGSRKSILTEYLAGGYC